MKKLYFQVFAMIFFLLSAVPVSARENVNYWYIKDFQSEIVVNKDASLDITERIIADCGTAQGKHGIFRVLPLKYKTVNETFSLPTEVISVTDFNSNNVEYNIIKDKETLTIKIGSAGVTVHGVNNYIIKYHVKNAIRTGNTDFDELYWNLSGNFWDIEVDNFAAKVIFPAEINKSNTEVNYYVGALDSNQLDVKNFYWLSDNAIKFIYPKTIKTGDGVTASVTFPKNIITPAVLTAAENGEQSPVIKALGYVVMVLLPLLAFLISFRVWGKYGRDPKFDKTIIPEFEIPENLSPIEMGGIMKSGGFDNKFITASMINLAVLGYLKIEEIVKEIIIIKSKDYKLIRSEKEAGNDLHKSEAVLLEKLFAGGKGEILLSDLKNKFYLQIPSISRSLKNDLEGRGLASKRDGYMIAMIMLGVILAILGFTVVSAFLSVGVGVLLSGLIIFVFGILMPQRSLAGTELNWRIQGFKLYMDTAEKYRERFNEKENIMEKLLPYAILFGMTKEWLKKMKDIYGDAYMAQHQPAFLMSAGALSSFDSFADSLNEITTSISSHVSSSPSGSHGGGSSGGGGGGGGGGGW